MNYCLLLNLIFRKRTNLPVFNDTGRDGTVSLSPDFSTIMIDRKQKRFYYSPNSSLELKEIKWFRTKVVGVVAALFILFVAVFLGVNQFLNAFGAGHDKLMALQQENQVLLKKIGELNAQTKGLETTLNQLGDQGNNLRLMVDLPALDEETKAGGTGGAVVEPDAPVLSYDASSKLKDAAATIQKLISETQVQSQSYKQILGKYEFNKGYFSAMPALKPMDGYYSVKGFGLRMHPVLGMFRTHQGLDIINDVGTPVVASGDGVVEMAGQSGGGYGIAVMINHGYGFQTLYAHLSRAVVHEGDHVKRGMLIGKSGKTGLVTGPHLHYEVRYKGVCQNPMDYFLDDVSPKDYQANVALH